MYGRRRRSISGTVITVLIVLFLALRSWRISLAGSFRIGRWSLVRRRPLVFFVVGKLNLVSIAFAVLFIGLGCRFRSAIQRPIPLGTSRRQRSPKSRCAAQRRRRACLWPSPRLQLHVAFFSFLPTDFRGLSELGEIAGLGMLIAFFTTITVLPAALPLSKPPAEPRPMGFERLAPIDRFTMAHRIPILVVTLGNSAGARPLCCYACNSILIPTHLQNPNVEAVATFLDLKSDPNTGANAINVLAPSLPEAKNIAARLAALPQVSQTRTIDTFIPDAQDRKLADIANAMAVLNPVLGPAQLRPAPTDAEIVEALNSAADALLQASGGETNPGATAAARLATLLKQLAAADPSVRAKASSAFAAPLRYDLDQLRLMLNPQRITLPTLPASVARDWVAPDGKARVQVLPKGDSNNDTVLRDFASAVLAIEPAATGTPVMFQEAARIIVHAFIEATALALVSIAIILLIALRRIRRRSAHTCAADRRGPGDVGNLRPDRLAAEFRQHYRPATPAWRRCRFQNLLHRGLAKRQNQLLGINIDPCRDLQRHDHGNGIRQPVAVQRTGYIQHGQAVGAIACVYTLGGCAVSTDSYGATASEGKPRWEQSTRLKS